MLHCFLFYFILIIIGVCLNPFVFKSTNPIGLEVNDQSNDLKRPKCKANFLFYSIKLVR